MACCPDSSRRLLPDTDGLPDMRNSILRPETPPHPFLRRRETYFSPSGGPTSDERDELAQQTWFRLFPGFHPPAFFFSSVLRRLVSRPLRCFVYRTTRLLSRLGTPSPEWEKPLFAAPPLHPHPTLLPHILRGARHPFLSLSARCRLPVDPPMSKVLIDALWPIASPPFNFLGPS